jgi:hypothetical protein
MTDWDTKMRETVQPHVQEPVVAVGMLQPAGMWGAAGVAQLSGLAGTLMRKAANKKAGGLAKNSAFSTKMAMIAITDGKLYAFNAKPKGRQWKIVDSAGEWERSDLTITKTPGKLSTKVVLDVASTGEHYELEATTAMTAGNFNNAFLAALDPAVT